MNSKRLILLAVCITCMVLSHSCAKQVKGYSKPDNAIEVKAGEDFIITLESNRTTGYQWQLARPLDVAVLELVGSEYKAGESRLIGSGGSEVWTFRAVGAGKTPIAFKYIRPWEKDPPCKGSCLYCYSQELINRRHLMSVCTVIGQTRSLPL